MVFRALEIPLFLCFACGVIAVTFILVFNNRDNVPDVSKWCGPSYENFSVDITDQAVPVGDGFNWTEGNINIFFKPGTFWKNESGNIFGCPCTLKPCVPKCCLKYQQFNDILECDNVNGSSEMEIYNGSAFNTLVRDNFVVVHNPLPSDGINDIVMAIPQLDHPNLLNDGRLSIRRPVQPYLNQEQYCVDEFNNTLVFLERKSNVQISGFTSSLERMKRYAMVVSLPFLLLSLLLLMLVPSLQNFHGKTLFCYVLCLTVTYMLTPLRGYFTTTVYTCYISAAVTNIAFLGSFFWLNVISLDIWLTFRVLSPTNKRTTAGKLIERRKFLLYSVYAWGGPALITAVVMFMDLSPLVPDHYVKPGFILGGCWYNGKDASDLYYFLPPGVLMGLNCIMFSTTACRLWAYSSKSKGLSSESGKQRFSIYGKLFIVMGVNWVLEVASYLIKGNDLFWIASDLANSLLGVIIFVLFLCKKSILEELRRKFCPACSTQLHGPNSYTTRWSLRSSRTSSAVANVVNSPVSHF